MNIHTIAQTLDSNVKNADQQFVTITTKKPKQQEVKGGASARPGQSGAKPVSGGKAVKPTGPPNPALDPFKKNLPGYIKGKGSIPGRKPYPREVIANSNRDNVHAKKLDEIENGASEMTTRFYAFAVLSIALVVFNHPATQKYFGIGRWNDM